MCVWNGESSVKLCQACCTASTSIPGRSRSFSLSLLSSSMTPSGCYGAPDGKSWIGFAVLAKTRRILGLQKKHPSQRQILISRPHLHVKTIFENLRRRPFFLGKCLGIYRRPIGFCLSQNEKGLGPFTDGKRCFLLLLRNHMMVGLYPLIQQQNC